jgi:hypothetical protein
VGTRISGNEDFRERGFQGTRIPGNEDSRDFAVLLGVARWTLAEIREIGYTCGGMDFS